MFAELARVLTCPVCGNELRLDQRTLRCAAGHGFDLARQGYANLLAGSTPPGTADTVAMVQARADFLAADHYAPLAQRIAQLAAASVRPGLVLDAGAGTGYYLKHVLDALPGASGLALDISKFALRRAARCHARAAAVVWDLWRPLPVKSASASLILNVFAPRNGAEFRRVLQDDGVLLVVTPTPQHLAELVDAFGMITVDTRKEERLDETLAGHFELAGREQLEVPLRLTRLESQTLVHMGPSAHHLSAQVLQERAERLNEPVHVTAAFTLSLYRVLSARDRVR